MHKKIIVTDFNAKVEGCDGFIFNSTEYSCYPEKTYTKEELLNVIIAENLSKYKLILNVDKIIAEEELENLKEYLNDLEEYFDYIIYSDYAIYQFIQNKDKLIYDSKTLVCSYQEVLSLDTKTFLSLELSYEEIEAILDNIPNDKVALNVFGLHQIMYSKRPLLSIYNAYKENECLNKFHLNKFYLNKFHLYDLREEQRDEKYKIIETNNGTFIYTPFYYALMKNINNLDKVFMFRIISSSLQPEIINKLIAFYKDIENINPKTFKSLIDKPIKEGFLTKKLFLLKDEDNE